jgi:hypothetical protein
MKLSNLVVESFIQKFEETDNFCGFTLPFVFPNGSPAVIHAQRHHADDLHLSDYGMNLESLINSINNERFDALSKVQEIIRPFESLQLFNGAIVSETNASDLMFVLLDYSDVLKAMVDYKYSPRVSHVEDILIKIRQVLDKQYQHLQISPEILGRSGNKYKFNFGSDNTMIDFTTAKTDRTNKLLRKYVDTQHSNPDLNFTVIIDDLESDHYKSEQTILSDFARVQLLSRYISAT